MKPLFTFSILVLLCLSISAQNFTISGYIKSAETSEALIGATVYTDQPRRGGFSNSYGFFSLTLPAGSYKLIASYVGYQADTQLIELNANRTLEILLKESVSSVEEVVISASQDAYAREVKSTQMSQIQLNVRDIRLVPTIAGETDIMKVIQYLPGVTKGGEGTTTILVRGGDPDQNLILLDEAVVYNVSHLFGFFSVFNQDALKDLTLIKGGFPAQYGGRLSSVLDLTMKEGNQNKFHARGGIGLLSSRLTVEGPIVKNKSSFIVSARRSYIDQVLRVVRVPVPYYFYDLNVKANYILNDKNRLYVSSYFGDDVLYTPKSAQNDSAGLGEVDFGFRLGNFTTTLRWNHLFSERLFSNTSLIYTRFKYDINGNVGENGIFIGSKVNDIGVKSDFTFYKDPENTIRYGLQITNHRFVPNVITASGDVSELINNSNPTPIYTQELALYAQHERQLGVRLRLNYGLRLSGALTPSKFYPALEPRASMVYVLNEKNSFKAGYARMMQYLHLVSSSTVALPTDLWYPVTDRVKPQSSDQLSASYTHHFESIGSIFTFETYYKWMRNLTEYREGANLILNNNFENELLQGKGWAYGFEFLLKRDEGRIHGWLAYTLAFAQRQFDGINQGNPFWARYDRRHDLSLVAIWQINKRLALSGVYTYLSGARFTPQIGQYLVPSPTLTSVEIIPIFTERNAVRLTAANRVDINFTLMAKETKKIRSEWSFGCYNVMNSPTPIRVNINYSPEKGLYYTQPSFIGRLLSVAWNFDI